MTASTHLTPREQQDLRDACLSGLVPCSGLCTGDRTLIIPARESNANAWSGLLALARADRQKRAASWSPRGLSLAAAARDAGLVPHTASQDREPFGCDCARRQRIQRDAAAAWATAR